MDYRLQLPNFEGPLDLLLQLVERAELDITRVALARVTGQYLEALQELGHLEPEELAGFLSIASKLILIKSQLLLPGPPPVDEGDAGDELVRQLEEYRRYKQVAEALGELDRSGRRAFVRVAPPPLLPPKVDLEGVELEDLARLVREVLSEKRPEPEAPQALGRAVTIEDFMARIEGRLAEGPVGFVELLRACRTRLEVVVAFMAILELLRRRQAGVSQEGLFGEIVIVPVQPPG